MALLIFVFLLTLSEYKKKKNLKEEEKLLYPKEQNTIHWNSKITKLSLDQKKFNLDIEDKMIFLTWYNCL
jgi:hypothetical protein